MRHDTQNNKPLVTLAYLDPFFFFFFFMEIFIAGKCYFPCITSILGTITLKKYRNNGIKNLIEVLNTIFFHKISSIGIPTKTKQNKTKQNKKKKKKIFFALECEIGF